MTTKNKIGEILKQMLRNELKSVEMGILLRSYATPEELNQIQLILENCKHRQKSHNVNVTGTLLTEFFAFADAKRNEVK